VSPITTSDSALPPQPTAENARTNLFRRPLVIAIIQGALAALLLLMVCDWHSIYEEDQLAKTAQIISLDADSNWKHLSTTMDYYSKDLFSAYYLAALAFYKLSHLPALEALNCFSILCGVIFFAVTPWCVRRAFQLSQWLAWCVLVSAPLLVITFNYGNEAAFAIMMAGLAAFALTFNHPCARIIAAVFYVGAAYSRSDYLFLGPALAFITLVRKDGKVDWRESFRRALPFIIAAAVLGVAYLMLVLRHWPERFDYRPKKSLALTLAFFGYSPNLVAAAFALVGFISCLVRRRFEYLLLSLVFVQYLPYVTHLASPKYILPSVVAMLIFAIVGMMPVLKRAPRVLVILLALPWVVAVSPYGSFGPGHSAYWYVPTDDGPLPIGGLVGFYPKVKHGFYQRRYDQELEQIAQAMPLIDGGRNGDLVGWFNVGTMRLWAARNQRWDIPATNMPFWANQLEAEGTHGPQVLLKTSYLYVMKQGPALQIQLSACYNEGRVKVVSSDGTDPFPDVIQCGQLVAKDTDRELGARIQFLNSFFHQNHVLRCGSFVREFSGVSWISRARYEKEGPSSAKPLYMDSAWACLSEDVPDAIYYCMRFPPVYALRRQEMN
jgi:hypothetical protein